DLRLRIGGRSAIRNPQSGICCPSLSGPKEYPPHRAGKRKTLHFGSLFPHRPGPDHPPRGPPDLKLDIPVRRPVREPLAAPNRGARRVHTIAPSSLRPSLNTPGFVPSSPPAASFTSPAARPHAHGAPSAALARFPSILSRTRATFPSTVASARPNTIEAIAP